MIVNFDKFNQADPPAIFLCNPNKDKLSAITRVIYNTKLILRFNALSEFSFEIPQSIDNKLTIVDAYGLMKVKRLIFIDGIGYFVIVSATENSDGSVPVYTVECQSLESELASKKVNILSGTCRLYAAGSTSIVPQENLLGYLLSLAPNWHIGGTIDASLESKYRTFDVSDTTIYNFMMTDIEKAYECVFSFDIINRLVYVDTLTNAVTDTDIFISYDNLAQETELSEMSDEIATALHVYGGDALDIRSVNPLGTNVIYNFTYYKNTNWMSQGLVDAITAWENKIASYQIQYYALLASLMTYNNELGVLQSSLGVLQTEYSALEVTLKGTIESGGNVGLAQSNLTVKGVQVAQKQVEITSKNSQISGVTTQVQGINNVLSFTTNFTEPQFLELSTYIIENTYQNENIIITDSFTPNQIQETKLELYTQASSVLNRVSYPRYEFSVKSANFINLQQFSHFTTQVVMGAQITVDTTAYPIKSVLLELEMSYDNPEEFSLTFSNRLRLDDGKFQYSDLVGQTVKTGTSVSFDRPKWANWETNYKDTVSTFITSALNATTNEIINSTNQEIVINEAGMRGKYLNPDTGLYDPTQVWLTSNTLAFTDNNWQTSKLAIGKLNFGDGTSGYGVISDYLIGRIICGNQLTIANTNNNFVLDQTGATLTDAKFLMQSSVGGSGGLIIDPTAINIFSIGARVANQIPNPTFAVDINGNVSMSGNLDSGSNYIHTDGYAKIGLLTITPTDATFAGNISANKIDGTIDWSQITNAPLAASRVGSGYPGTSVGSGYPASYLGGGTASGLSLTGNAGYITTSNTNVMAIHGLYTIGLNAPDVYSGITLYSGGVIIDAQNGRTLSLNASNISVNGSTGVTGSGQVNGSTVVTVTKGIVTGVSNATVSASTSGYTNTYRVDENPGHSMWVISNGLVKSITYSNP